LILSCILEFLDLDFLASLFGGLVFLKKQVTILS
jgi:hypothetical protein